MTERLNSDRVGSAGSGDHLFKFVGDLPGFRMAELINENYIKILLANGEATNRRQSTALAEV